MRDRWGRAGAMAASNARMDDRGRLLTGPCACGDPQTPYGWGGDLTAAPPHLGVWRCPRCWRAFLAALADTPAAAGAGRGAIENHGRLL
jgi:hypothetical protein